MRKKKNYIQKLSSPFSTGGGGYHFEAHVQASFVLLMLTGGCAPSLPNWPIKKVKLQGKIDGFETDDVIVYLENQDKSRQCKLLGQIKHSIAVTKGNKELGKVLKAAWRDFNNQELFENNQDIIALITSHLSATDNRNVQWLLNQARHTNSYDEFFRNIKETKFSPTKSEEKLEVFRYHLKAANNDVDVSDEELYCFLKRYHMLVYDLGEEIGVTHSLLHSHISQFNHLDPKQIWSRVVDIVQTWNKDAGTITPQNLPEDLVDNFQQRKKVEMPDYTSATSETSRDIGKSKWIAHSNATDLALVCLIGSWHESSTADKSILSKLIDSDYETWITKMQEIAVDQDSPLSFSNGLWKVNGRLKMLNSIGFRIFDQHLDKFRSLAVSVLIENDPSFELPANERFAASIYEKVLPQSIALRQGLSEGLAILGCRPNLFSNCSQGKAKATVNSTVKEIFKNMDWKLWGSLNFLLPALAEASPENFLDQVEKSLNHQLCPFDQLFAQESDGFFGDDYFTGLLWALESLAWNKEHLVRACVLLGALANRDPGVGWTNRSIESLITILLPWFPQTLASLDKRKAAVKTLCNEWPEIGWKVILPLLPNQNRTTSGTYKPKWRTEIPDDRNITVTHEEYWKQVFCYAELIVSTAGCDATKLAELVDQIDNLPKIAINKLIKVLDSSKISNLPEKEKLSIWISLKKVLSEHDRHPNGILHDGNESFKRIKKIEANLSPKNLKDKHQLLFTSSDYDLYEKNDNWEEQRVKLNERRDTAIKEIFIQDGIETLIQFAEFVKFSDKVGYALGSITDSTVEQYLFPEYFNSDAEEHSALVRGFIERRHEANAWDWSDKLDKPSWDIKQIAFFLDCLPFVYETWKRASQWLGRNESEYWTIAKVNPYHAQENLDFAIDRLIKYGRPHAAIKCLGTLCLRKVPICADLCIRALLTGPSSPEPSYEIDRYQIVELIKFLQSIRSVSQDNLCEVEWAYIPFLNRIYGGTPKTLEKKLASSPEFFCESIQLIYYSKNKDRPQSEPSDKSKAIATNAWHLLHNWQIPPGLQEDGTFSKEKFTSWLQQMKTISTNSGHLDVAMTTFGGVLIHSPPSPSALWIHPIIAEALNCKDAEHGRNGYRTAKFNSRGVHRVDPTGKPEEELATQFREKADSVENAGFHRFATTLRDLASTYEREAEMIRSEHSVF